MKLLKGNFLPDQKQQNGVPVNVSECACVDNWEQRSGPGKDHKQQL